MSLKRLWRVLKIFLRTVVKTYFRKGGTKTQIAPKRHVFKNSARQTRQYSKSLFTIFWALGTPLSGALGASDYSINTSPFHKWVFFRTNSYYISDFFLIFLKKLVTRYPVDFFVVIQVPTSASANYSLKSMVAHAPETFLEFPLYGRNSSTWLRLVNVDNNSLTINIYHLVSPCVASL